MINKYLITGPSGSGKTTVALELTKLGYKILETDHLPDLSNWTNIKTGQEEPHKPPFTDQWLSEHQWLWDKKKLRQILSEYPGENVFFIGGAANAHECFTLFSKVFALDVTGKELKQRLQQREPEKTVNPTRWLDQNPEIHLLLQWNNDFKLLYKKMGVTFIDGSTSPSAAAQKIISQTNP